VLLAATFTVLDWAVVIAYFALTSWFGAALAGKQATIREFFLGGRKLPWYAVSGSIVATEISALTFVSVPWVVFQPGGNLTYLQLGIIGSTLARIIVGYVLVPAYYEREIYSPYDYMGARLGYGVRGLTTALFAVSGVLAQAARIYLTAEVLTVVLADELREIAARAGLDERAWALAILMVVAVAWTLVGGMTTVIWTDVALFVAFLAGAVAALLVVVSNLSGGWGELFRVGWAATTSGVPWAEWGGAKSSGAWGKFTFFDFSTNPTRAYTFWAALIAATWGGVGSYGTDQLMAQRMFCCKGPRDARRAIISSAVAMVVTMIVALVGVGLYAYYQAHEPSPTGKALLASETSGDRIFPVFTMEVVPAGLRGVIVAAILAAAISSIMGVLTALSQTVQTAFIEPWRRRNRAAADSSGEEDRRAVRAGRFLVFGWAVALSLLAYYTDYARAFYSSILDLGLAAATYFSGGLLAGFLLAFLPLRVDGRGYLFAAPLSALCVFALQWHQPWAWWVSAAGGAALLACWLALSPRWWGGLPLGRTLMLLAGIGLVFALHQFALFPTPDGNATAPLAFPWYTPAGCIVALVWGYALAGRTESENQTAAVAR
jgi:SSS family solute:Na+ symporter